MRKTFRLLTISTMVVLLLVVTAAAQAYAEDGKNKSGPSPTATAAESSSQVPQTGRRNEIKSLRKTGGLSLAGPVVLASLGVVIGSGVAIRLVLHRYTSS